MFKDGKKGIVVAAIAILIFGGITIANLVRLKLLKRTEVIFEEIIPVMAIRSRLINLQWILEETGDIRPWMEVDVYPKVPGKIIEKLSVERGDHLKDGALVAELEDDTINAKLAEAKAVLGSALANLKQIEANLKVIEKDCLRLENLFREKAVSQQRLDHIEAKFTATREGKSLAESQIKKAEALLKQLKILKQDHRVYAPINGYISARYVDRGAMSNTGRPIIRISHEEKVKIVTAITERDFPHIKKGLNAHISVDAFPDKVFTGTISIINPTINPATRTGEIEIYLPNQDLLLKSGMFANIRIFLGEKRGLAIERDALSKVTGTGCYYLYVVEDGRARLRNVKTGIRQGNLVEIVEGLKEGELVVVKGQNRLKDGYLVQMVNNQKEAGDETS